MASTNTPGVSFRTALPRWPGGQDRVIEEGRSEDQSKSPRPSNLSHGPLNGLEQLYDGLKRLPLLKGLLWAIQKDVERVPAAVFVLQ